ncbi:MAG: hypothetical protein ABI396_11080, partial [Ktedonobacteraceae bacterium]
MAAGGLAGDILEDLTSLVDKSLLRQEEQAEGEVRFWMLQTLREFGLEQLNSGGELEGSREAHAEYYLRLVEEAEPYLQGTEQVRWLARLEQEHENVRTAPPGCWNAHGRMERKASSRRSKPYACVLPHSASGPFAGTSAKGRASWNRHWLSVRAWLHLCKRRLC